MEILARSPVTATAIAWLAIALALVLDDGVQKSNPGQTHGPGHKLCGIRYKS